MEALLGVDVSVVGGGRCARYWAVYKQLTKGLYVFLVRLVFSSLVCWISRQHNTIFLAGLMRLSRGLSLVGRGVGDAFLSTRGSCFCCWLFFSCVCV